MLLQSAAESNALKAVVSEGAGTRSIREHVHMSGIARWILLPQWSVITAATAVFSNHAPPPGLNELVGRISPRPVFLIYTPHGQGAETENPTFYAAAGEPKTIWEIPEASHTGGLDARPEEYERRVIAFFDEALLTGGPGDDRYSHPETGVFRRRRLTAKSQAVRVVGSSPVGPRVRRTWHFGTRV